MPHACKICEVIEPLQQHQHDDFVLCSLWCKEDVRNMDDSVTTHEVRSISHHASSHHNAEQDINRDTLEASLEAIRQ